MPPKPRPGPPPPSLEVFAQTVRNGVERVGKGFKRPDDDWVAMMHMENGRRETHVFSLMGELFVPESEDRGVAKDTLAAYLKGELVRFGATRFGLLLNTWAVEQRPEDDRPEWGRVHEHPERIEQLVVFVCDRVEDKLWAARIVRHEDAPPTLEPWKQSQGYDGRWINLREVLREEES